MGARPQGSSCLYPLRPLQRHPSKDLNWGCFGCKSSFAGAGLPSWPWQECRQTLLPAQGASLTCRWLLGANSGPRAWAAATRGGKVGKLTVRIMVFLLSWKFRDNLSICLSRSVLGVPLQQQMVADCPASQQGWSHYGFRRSWARGWDVHSGPELQLEFALLHFRTGPSAVTRNHSTEYLV